MAYRELQAGELSAGETASPQAPERAALIDRLGAVSRATGDEKLRDLITQFRAGRMSVDAINNRLMDNFRRFRSLDAYALIYELNYRQFLQITFKRLRFTGAILDPKDIVQDVFVSIYRYPDRFRDEKESSFRNWSYSIIRNTILKHLRQRDTSERSADAFADVLEDRRQAGPFEALDQRESLETCHRLYLIYLLLYMRAYESRLSERERRALHLVEIEGMRYREAAAELHIKLENLKMVICRARKKILRSIHQMIGGERS
ncbi:MAG: sigma-70 family RNA polymerase sigma factor [Planctomycetota bacterium]